jgi:Flp pilus assembly protein TadD
MKRIIKFEGDAVETGNLKSKLRAWANGEMTWAEVEGMTFEEAKAIAQVGCELAASGRLEEARGVFEGLVEGNPRDAAMRAALGTVYQKLGRVQDAMTEYSAALERDPKNPVALTNRGELRLRSGDRQGLNDLALAVEADPHGETHAGRRAKSLIRAITLMAVQVAKSQTEQGL